MVSTRGVRYKFSEGERVLCYEPDPTKAKVLYDSKVLEVIESKDKRGRRTVEYLIHFQGWNSSWDRCVSEDFVLKDTEENRQLQRDLAEKSQLQLGAYLYRRERKKGGSTSTAGAGPGPAKRPRHGFSDDGSSSSTQPDYNTEDDGRRPNTPEEDSSRSGEESPRAPSPPIAFVGRAVITLPSALRDRLTFDYHLVVKRGRLSHLPATPCAAQILESFVKWYARSGAWHETIPRTTAHEEPQLGPNLLDVSRRLNLVREVADGMRVYFDFILRNHLLYKQELNQYHEICGQFIDEHEACKKRELEGADEYDDEPMGPEEEVSTAVEEDVLTAADEDLKSPKIPDYSHLPPDPMDADKSEGEGESNTQDDGVASKSDSNDKPAANPDSAPDDNQAGGSGKKRESRPATRSGSLARRLRSHKSAVSQSENDEPAPSTSTGEPRMFEAVSSSVGSSASSLSEIWARPASAAPLPPVPRTPLSQLLDKVAKWQIIPREGTEHLPCRVYGAIHLARLFVKLPDFLNALPQMSDIKLKLVLKHVDMFIHYLEQHGEWFGEIYYVADTTCRSR